MNESEGGLQRLDDLIASALKAGADAADAVLVEGASLGVSWRDQKMETLEHAEGADLGLRVLIGKKQAIVSSTDHRAETLAELVTRAVSMARLAPEDPYCGIADPAQLISHPPVLDLCDETDVTPEFLIAKAREAEDYARAYQGITQVEGIDAGASHSHVYLAASNGFRGDYKRSHYSLGLSVLAGSGLEMELGGEYKSMTYLSDLPAPATIAEKACRETVRKLGARKMPTCQVPVVYERELAASLLSSLSGAINGSGVARGVSFLKDRLGQQILPKGITIIDDPLRPRGMRSKAFDAEGLPCQRREIVVDGVLQTWLLDLRTSRQLGMQSTGHASRGTSGIPSPSCTNLYMQAGTITPADLIRDIKQGFFVTETMGHGVNGVTGDYSLAARGLWIENGEITFPVNEMTIAGNLKDMFLNLTPADDLKLEDGIDSPTLRVEGMTVAGI